MNAAIMTARTVFFVKRFTFFFNNHGVEIAVNIIRLWVQIHIRG